MKLKKFCLFSAIISAFLLRIDAPADTSAPYDSSAYEKAPREWFAGESQKLNYRLYPGLVIIADSLGIPSQLHLRSAPNKAFRAGERLVFSISFGFLKAGVGILEIPDTCIFRGDPCFRIVSRAISNRFVSTFYPVRDIFMSLVEINGLYPLVFEKHLQEGGYRNDCWILFDHKSRTAHWSDTSFSIARYAQDVISALYYVRTIAIEPGSDVWINSHADKKNYPLAVKWLGRETLKVPAGRFECIILEPVLRYEGLFKQKGRLKVWLTADERRMPICMKSEIYFIGSITANLISYR